MKSGLLWGTIIVFVLSAQPGFAGKFSGWSGPFKVQIQVPEPPVAYIGKKSAKITVSNTPPGISAEQVRTLIEQALAPDILATDSVPEAFFKVNVTSFEPPKSRQYTLSERYQVKVGDRPTYNKNGTQSGTEPVYQEQVLPVQYWEGDASLSVSVDVKSASGALLDSFTPRIAFNEKLRLSVGNESTPEAGNVPDDRHMLNSLTSQLAGQFRHRYARTERSDTVLLAIDDELKAGNAMAHAGKWDEALKQWESVKMKKNESDRVFNMAVADEMLAYSTYRSSQDMQTAFPLFAKALEMYNHALQADPTEKYIQQAQARIMRAKTSMDTAMKHYQAQAFEAEKLEQEIAAKREKEQEIETAIQRGAKGDIAVPDSAAEVKFRTYTRTRLHSLTGDPSDEQIQTILTTAKGLYNVDGDRAKRIAYEEMGRKRSHDKGIALYRENLTEFAKDKRIDADERSVLNDIRTQYNLPDPEISQMEKDAGVVQATIPKPSKPSTVHRPVRSN